MTATITDNTADPIIVASGATATPFSNIIIDDPLLITEASPNAFAGDDGTISIVLSPGKSTSTSLGTLGNGAPSGNGNLYEASTFNAATGSFIKPTSYTKEEPFVECHQELTRP